MQLLDSDGVSSHIRNRWLTLTMTSLQTIQPMVVDGMKFTVITTSGSGLLRNVPPQHILRVSLPKTASMKCLSQGTLIVDSLAPTTPQQLP
jgi:hypothetical protein